MRTFLIPACIMSTNTPLEKGCHMAGPKVKGWSVEVGGSAEPHGSGHGDGEGEELQSVWSRKDEWQ